MNKKNLILYSFAAIMLVFGLVDYMDYQKHNYDVTKFVFICNDNLCEIRHKKANGETKYTEKIDIKNIKSFSTRSEKIPRTNDLGLVIYANCKDGTSFRLSPIYVKPSRYVERELIQPLNNALRKDPIYINMRFPN